MSFTQTPHVKTPNMEAMKRNGVSFNRCYSNLPICTPYRAILMTGRWPYQQGLMANHMNLGERVDMPVEKKERGTLGHVFHDAGYDTCYIGKWHLGKSNLEPFGFDKACSWHGEDHGKMVYIENGEKKFWTAETGYSGVPAHPPHPAMPDHNYKIIGETDQALNWIDERASASDKKPFFLMLSLQDPHGPWTDLPPHLLDLYPDESALPFQPNDEKRQWGVHQKYHASVSAVDEQLGRIMRKLDEAGIADNTILVYTSDHGGMGHALGYGQKRMPHDNSARVPFLLQWRGTVPDDLDLDCMFSSIDIFPTLCGLAGVGERLSEIKTPQANESLEYLNDCPGLDFSPNALGRKGGPDPRSVFVAHPSNMNNRHGHVQVSRAVVTKHHMYAVTPEKEWMLHDLEADPYQMNNLIDSADTPEIRRELREELRGWIERAEAPFIDRWFANAADDEIEHWNAENGIEPLDDREAGKAAVFDLGKVQ